MSLTRRYFKSDITFSSTAAIALVIATMGLSGCKTSEVMNNGYIFDPQSLALAPVGSSREQVLLSLGTPSTTATFDGEVFYYISQKRTRAVAFMKPKLVDQNILAIYFDKTGVGRDITFLQQILQGGAAGGVNGARNFLNNLNPGQ